MCYQTNMLFEAWPLMPISRGWAQNPYYGHLKRAAKTMTKMTEMAGSETEPGGIDLKTATRAAVNLFQSQFEATAIELDATRTR